MIEGKQLTVALATIPAVALCAGYIFNLGYLASFDASLFSMLTIQDHVSGSLRWTSLVAAAAVVLLNPIWRELYSLHSRVIQGQIRVNEWTRKTFAPPLVAMLLLLPVPPLIAFQEWDDGSRNKLFVFAAIALLCASLGQILLFVLTALLRLPQSPMRRHSFSMAVVLILPAAVMMLMGGLNAQRIAGCRFPTHLVQLEGGGGQSIIPLQFAERGLVGFQVSGKATVVYPWSKVASIRQVRQICSDRGEIGENTEISVTVHSIDPINAR